MDEVLSENEMDFLKSAKEIDFVEKEIKGVKRFKVNIRHHGSYREVKYFTHCYSQY